MTPFKNGELKYLILSLLKGSLTYKELKRFYHICYSIASSYLKVKKYYGKLYFKIQYGFENDIHDLAEDCIITLFKQEKHCDFPLFGDYFEKCSPDLQVAPEAELFLLLKRLIISKVDQELVIVFKKNDPEGFRLLRNINLTVQRHKQIMESQWCDDCYLYLQHNNWTFPDDYIQQRCTIYYDDLLNLLYTYLCYQNDFPKLIHAVLTQIEHENKYAYVLGKNQLHSALKHILTLHTPFMDPDSLPADKDPEVLNSRRDKIINSLLSHMKPVIKEVYFDKGKIDTEIFNIYETFIRHYFSDLLNDGYVSPLPEYWKRMMINNDHFSEHKSRLEYLIRLGKEKIRYLHKKF